MDESIKIGDKLLKGYTLLNDGKWEGAYIFLEAVADLYMLDEIEEILYTKLAQYVSVMDVTREDTEASQWLKLVMLDARYGTLIIKPGDLMDNLVEKLNTLPVVPRNAVTEGFLEGEFGKVKYFDGSFFAIQHDYEKNLKFLVRIQDGNIYPLDFDIEDFDINRKEGRIEFHYIRGYKDLISIKPDGSDKKMIKSDGEISIEE